jgi:hypothetical protein
MKMYGRVEVYLHAPTALVHWIGNWVGPRASTDAMKRRKSLPLPGIEPSFPEYQVLSL